MKNRPLSLDWEQRENRIVGFVSNRICEYKDRNNANNNHYKLGENDKKNEWMNL